MTRAESREHGRRIRARLAELVIAKHWPTKQAAFELGLGAKATEWHVAKLKAQIRTSTNSLLQTV